MKVVLYSFHTSGGGQSLYSGDTAAIIGAQDSRRILVTKVMKRRRNIGALGDSLDVSTIRWTCPSTDLERILS